MIPKKLYFIWLGDGKPPNLQYVVQMYLKINAEFKISVIAEQNLEQPSNRDLKECVQLIKAGDNKYAEIFNSAYDGVNDDSARNAAVSEAFRCFLLDRHGGIYVDCDTFPVRRFDMKLLQHKYFHGTVRRSTGSPVEAASHFIGAEPGQNIYPGHMLKGKGIKPFLLYPDKLWENRNVRSRFAEKFRNRTLRFGNTYEQFLTQYVNHYCKNLQMQRNVYRDISGAQSEKNSNPVSICDMLAAQVKNFELSECTGMRGRIPKNLFLLWFGGDLPANFEYVKNAYCEANPDFNVRVYHENDIRTSKNEDVVECRNLIRRGDNKYSFIFSDAKHFKGNQYVDEIVFNTCFSDVFRCFLIDKYGGIYVDCDTFPVKPFDDSLLSHDKFHCTAKWTAASRPQLDMFFVGGQAGNDMYPGWVYKTGLRLKKPMALPMDDVAANKRKRSELQKKYEKQQLCVGETYGNGDLYVSHFFEKPTRWTSSCKHRQFGKTELPFSEKSDPRPKVLVATIVKNENNYGQRLQALATAEFLRNEYGARVKIADQRAVRDESPAFQTFEKLFVPLLDVKSADDVRKYGPDVMILGGDQVLNTNWSTLNQYCYGAFADFKNAISFSSSDGGNGLAQNRKNDVSNVGILRKFKAVSVRETATAEYLKSVGVCAEQHADPVFLLTRDEWRKFETRPEFVKSEIFDLSYMIGHFSGERNSTKIGKDGVPEYVCFGNTRQKDVPSPAEMLWMIDHCRNFSTSSFHGFSFSLIFGKDVRPLGISENPRVRMLFDIFGLERTELVKAPDPEKMLATQKDIAHRARSYFERNVAFAKLPAKSYKSCTGCMSCVGQCAKGAITKVEKEGFSYPSIDADLCVGCGKCETVCPTNSKKKELTARKAYSTASKNDNELHSSGGFVTQLAKKHVSAGGVVYGVEYSDDFKNCSFRREETVEGVLRQSGSKYVDAGSVPVQDIKKDLVSGRKVMFVGLPCQCASVHSSVGESSDLTIVSLICNSVPSADEWRKFVERVEARRGSKLNEVNMRHNVNDMLMRFENGDTVIQPNLKSEWHCKFLKDDSVIRPSCKACLFKYPRILADFIVGDSWGLSGNGKGKLKCNTVFCMTEKSESLLDGVRDVMEVSELSVKSTLDRFKSTNPRLFSPR